MKTLSKLICLMALTAAVFFPTNYSAQSSKGDWALGVGIGNFNYSNNAFGNFSNGGNFHLTIGPSLGYFFTKDLVIGAGLYLNYYNQWIGKKSSIINKNNFGTIGLTPFVRYYLPLKDLTNRFYLQVEGGSGVYFLQKYQNFSYDNSGKQTQFSETVYTSRNAGYIGAARVGFQRTISTNVALNTSVGLTYNKVNQTWYSYWEDNQGHSTKSSPQSRSFETSTLFWNLGITVFLPSKKKS